LRGRLGATDLLVKVACFVKDTNNIFNVKGADLKRVSARRSRVLSLPVQ
jgi:hypothetical protein